MDVRRFVCDCSQRAYGIGNRTDQNAMKILAFLMFVSRSKETYTYLEIVIRGYAKEAAKMHEIRNRGQPHRQRALHRAVKKRIFVELLYRRARNIG